MTVSNTSTKSIFTGNSLTTVWPIGFSLNGVTEEEVLVYITTISTGVSELQTTNYSVDLTAATVTYPTVGSALSSSYKIVILRKLTLNQETDFVNQGNIPAEDIEASLDRFVMACQQIQEQLDRTAQSDVSGSSADSEIGALLTAVSDARDETTIAAAATADYADSVYASVAVASAYASSLSTSQSAAAASAVSAATSASVAAVSAAAALVSANAAAVSAGTFTNVSFQATKSSAQTISASTTTKVTWDTEDVDTGGYFASSKFTSLVSGKYYISAYINFSNLPDSKQAVIYIYKNGAAVYQSVFQSRGGTYQASTVGAIVTLNGSTDYVEIYVSHNDASSCDIVGTPYTGFSGFKVGS